MAPELAAWKKIRETMADRKGQANDRCKRACKRLATALEVLESPHVMRTIDGKGERVLPKVVAADVMAASTHLSLAVAHLDAAELFALRSWGLNPTTPPPYAGSNRGDDSVATRSPSAAYIPGDDHVETPTPSANSICGDDHVETTSPSAAEIPGDDHVEKPSPSADSIRGDDHVVTPPPSAVGIPGDDSVAKTPSSTADIPGDDPAETPPPSAAAGVLGDDHVVTPQSSVDDNIGDDPVATPAPSADDIIHGDDPMARILRFILDNFRDVRALAQDALGHLGRCRGHLWAAEFMACNPVDVPGVAGSVEALRLAAVDELKAALPKVRRTIPPSIAP